MTCTSLQIDYYASTSPLSFNRPDALPAAQSTASKHWRQELQKMNYRKEGCMNKNVNMSVATVLHYSMALTQMPTVKLSYDIISIHAWSYKGSLKGKTVTGRPTEWQLNSCLCLSAIPVISTAQNKAIIDSIFHPSAIFWWTLPNTVVFVMFN